MVSVLGEHGFDLKPGAWKLPATITPDMAQEAREQLVWAETVQLSEASTSAMKGWLLALGNANASSAKLTAADVEAKVSILLTLMDEYPAGVFTKASLKRAARRFRFFPGFEELAPFLDDEEKALRQKRERLQAIAYARLTGPTGKPAEEAPYISTPEQRNAVQELLRSAGIGLKELPCERREGEVA